MMCKWFLWIGKAEAMKITLVSWSRICQPQLVGGITTKKFPKRDGQMCCNPSLFVQKRRQLQRNHVYRFSARALKKRWTPSQNDNLFFNFFNKSDGLCLYIFVFHFF